MLYTTTCLCSTTLFSFLTLDLFLQQYWNKYLNKNPRWNRFSSFIHTSSKNPPPIIAILWDLRAACIYILWQTEWNIISVVTAAAAAGCMSVDTLVKTNPVCTLCQDIIWPFCAWKTSRMRLVHKYIDSIRSRDHRERKHTRSPGRIKKETLTMGLSFESRSKFHQ